MPAIDDQLQRRNEFFISLQEIVGDLLTELDLAAVMQKTVERVAELSGAEPVTMHIYDPQTGETRAPVGCGLRKREVFEKHRPAQAELVRRLMEKDEPTVADDVTGSELAGSFADREGIRSAAAFPFRIGERDIGMLFVDYRHPHHFEPEEIRFLESFSGLAAVAINAAISHEQAEARAETIRQLGAVGQSVAELQESPEVLQETLRLIAKTALQGLQADAVDLYEYRADEDDFVLPPITVGERYHPELVPDDILSDDVVARIARTGKPIYAPRAQRDPVLTGEWEVPREGRPEERFVVREEIVSSAGVPLMTGDEVIGVLFVSYRKRHDFDIEIELRERLEFFASQAASAILSARRLQEERILRQQAEALREISGAISAALKLEKVAERIIDELGKVVKYRKATMQLVRDDVRELIAYRGFGEEAISEWLLRPVSSDPLIKRVVKSHKPLILSEPALDADWESRSETADVKSWVAVPLVYGGEAIGLLTLDHDEPGFYTQALERFLISFGSQAAIAIQNAHLFDDAQRRIRDLEIVNKVTQAISTQLDIEDVLHTIVSEIRKELSCSHCTVFFPRIEQDELLLVPQVTDGERRVEIMTRRFRPGKGLAGWVFKHGESLVLKDAKEDDRFSAARDPRDQPRSMLVAPVKIGDRTIGVISADQDEYGWFSDSDRRLVDALAGHAAIAIERATVLRLLQDISTQIGARFEEEETVDTIIKGAMELTGTESGVIHLLTEDKTEVLRSYEVAKGFSHLPSRFAKKAGLTWEIVNEGEILAIPDVTQDGRVNPEMLATGVRAMIGVPLSAEGETIGALFLNDSDVRVFTEYEKNLLSTLATQAATAIRNARLFRESAALAVRNARLFRESEELASRLEKLQQVTMAISAGELELDKVFDRIAANLAEMFGEVSCVVRLYDPNTGEFGLWFSAGFSPEQISRPPRPDGTSQYIVKTKTPRYFEDLTVSPSDGGPAVRPEILDEGVRATAQLPLIIEDAVTGILYVSLREAHRFSENDRRILELFAGQAAIAIKKTQLYAELEAILTAMTDVVLVYDGQGRYLEIPETAPDLLYKPAAEMLGKSVVEVLPQDAADTIQDAIRRSLDAKEVVSIEYNLEITGDEKWFEARVSPMSENTVVFVARDITERKAAEEELQRLNQLANRKVKDLQAVYEVGERVTAGIHLTEPEILELIHEQASEVMDTKNMYIALYDPATDSVRFGLALLGGRRVDVETEEGWGPRKAGEGRTEWIIRHREPLYSFTRADSEAWYQQPGRKEYIGQPFASWIGVPMIAREEVLGVIATYHATKEHVYDTDDLEVLSLMANQAAIALENARLLRQLERRIAELNVLQALAEDLSAGVLPGTD